MPTDMRKDFMAETSSGKAALRKMAEKRPISENFRLYFGTHIGDGKGIKYKGAEFEEDGKGQLTKMVRESILTAEVTPEDASEFEF